MSTAIITASYERDFQRCALLCQSMDTHLLGPWHHYILVEDRDFDLFQDLQSIRRTIISERDLFPWWFRSFPDVISSKHKRVWLSPFSKPMRGWHAQQFRRLAVARLIDEPTMLSIDSDVVMVRDFDVANLYKHEKLRFYRCPEALGEEMIEHLSWAKNAAKTLGILQENSLNDDYINTFIAWKTKSVKDMLDHIERMHGMHWLRVIPCNGAVSECMLYGKFVHHVQRSEGHFENADPLCKVVWDENTIEPNIDGLTTFLSQLKAEQVAVGVQSFVGLKLDDIKQAIDQFKKQSEPKTIATKTA